MHQGGPVCVTIRDISYCAADTKNCLCTWYLIFPLLLCFNSQQMLT